MAVFRQLFVSMMVSVTVLFRRLIRGPQVVGWTYRFEVLVAILRHESRRQAPMRPARVRAQMLNAPVPRSIAAHITHGVSQVAGLPVETITPAGWAPGGLTVLYLHGGGYVVCSPGTHRDVTSRIAVATGARLVVLDYRLAPEHPYPAGVDDADAAWQALSVEPGPLAVAGDSAGGGLALALMLRLRQRGEAMPVAAALISPWVDLTIPEGSVDGNADDYLDRPVLERFAAHCLQGADPREPEVSPVFADLSGLPPLLVMTGGAEVFLDENRHFAARAEAAGTAVTLRVGEGMVHAWPAFAAILPEGRVAIDEIGAFLSRHASLTVP